MHCTRPTIKITQNIHILYLKKKQSERGMRVEMNKEKKNTWRLQLHILYCISLWLSFSMLFRLYYYKNIKRLQQWPKWFLSTNTKSIWTRSYRATKGTNKNEIALYFCCFTLFLFEIIFQWMDAIKLNKNGREKLSSNFSSLYHAVCLEKKSKYEQYLRFLCIFFLFFERRLCHHWFFSFYGGCIEQRGIESVEACKGKKNKISSNWNE